MLLLNTDQAPGAIGPYSQGVEVNGFVITSGQIPVDPTTSEIPKGIAAQAEQCCKNVGAILADQNLARLSKQLAFWRIWLTSPHLMKSMQSISHPNPPGVA